MVVRKEIFIQNVTYVLIVAIGICLISVLLVDEHSARAVNVGLATQLASGEL